jgi:hypothetical protein
MKMIYYYMLFFAQFKC